MLRVLKQLQPDVVIYCPMVNREAAVAARLHGIPSIALLTHAGPGSFESLTQQFLSELNMTPDDMYRVASDFEPNQVAIQRLKNTHGLEVDVNMLGADLKIFG